MMMQKALLALALAAGTAAAAGDCKASTLDFVMLEGEASHAAIIAAAVVALVALCCIGAMAKKEKEGRPVFAPVVQNPVNERAAEKA